MESPVQPQSETPSINPTLKPPQLTPPRRIRFILSKPPPPPPAGNQPVVTMEDRFRDAIMKIANNSANRMRFTGRHKTLIEDTLTDFLADFHTPDHPPYAAMILRAIEGLKEKRGSSEESISKYIKNEYKDLPWAHYTLLKHHLGKLCDAGEVIVTNKQLYLLAGANFSLSNSSGPKEKLKRKRGSASGRMKSKRFKKHKTREDNREIEVMEGKHPLTGKYHEEIKRQNEIVEREAEMIEEDSQLLALPIKMIEEDSQLLTLPIEMIKEHVEDDQQHRKVPDYEENDQQSEMIERQSLKLTNSDGFVEEHRSESDISSHKQQKTQLLKKRSGLKGQQKSTSPYAEQIQLENQKVEKVKEKNLLVKQQNKENENIQPGSLQSMSGEVACDDNDKETTFDDHSRVLPSGSHGKPNVSDSERRHIGLELVSMEQDEILHQLDLLTPAKPQEPKRAPEGSNQIKRQRSKLRSWKREKTSEKNTNKEAESLSSSLTLKQPESKHTRKESSKILVQRSKLRSWKQQNQSEQNTDSLYSSLASPPPALSCPQKLKIEEPAKGKRGRPAKVSRIKLKLLKDLENPDAED